MAFRQSVAGGWENASLIVEVGGTESAKFGSSTADYTDVY